MHARKTILMFQRCRKSYNVCEFCGQMVNFVEKLIALFLRKYDIL